MEKYIKRFNEYREIIGLAIALILFFIHLHSDVKMMQYVQAQHENQIKELFHNQNVTLRIIATHINRKN
jgi:hypothetical protein